MRILIIAHDVGSKEMGMLFRPYYIAQGLKARGHEVEIITASYSRVRRVNPDVKKDLEKSDIEGITYHWIKSLKFSGNTIQRALGMFLFSFKLWAYAKKIKDGFMPDVVIASSPHPLVIFGAHRLAKLANAKLFFEVRDIWPLSMHELSGMKKSHPFYILCQWAEDFAYKKSQKVISLLPYAFPHMQSRGLTEEQFVYIPNGYDSTELLQRSPLSPSVLNLLSEFKTKHPFTVGYAGAHGLANSLESLLEAFSILKDQSKFGLILIGEGAEKPFLMEKVKALNLDNVLFLDPVAKPQVPAVLDFFSVAYIGLKKSPLFKYGVSPNKLIDYMASAKPVLYAIETDRDPVSESGCGRKVPADDPVKIAEGIVLMSKLSSEELAQMGHNGKAWVEANLAYSKLLDRFESLFR